MTQSRNHAEDSAVEAFIDRWRDTGGKERANYQLFLTECTWKTCATRYPRRLVDLLIDSEVLVSVIRTEESANGTVYKC